MQYSEDTTGYAVLRVDLWVFSARSAQGGPLGMQCSGGTTGYAVLRGDHCVCSAQGGPLGMQFSGGTTGYMQSEGTTGYAVLRGTTGYMQCSGGTTGYMGGPVYEVLRGHAGLICMQRICSLSLYHGMGKHYRHILWQS